METEPIRVIRVIRVL